MSKRHWKNRQTNSIDFTAITSIFDWRSLCCDSQSKKPSWTRSEFQQISFFSMTCLSNSLLLVKTDGYSSNPMLQQGPLRDVPTLIWQNDEHLIAKCAAKSPARARSKLYMASLSCYCYGVSTKDQWIGCKLHRNDIQSNQLCCLKTRNAKPEQLFRSM